MDKTLDTVRVQWRGLSFEVPGNFVSAYVNENGFTCIGVLDALTVYEHPATGESFYYVRNP